MTPDAQAVLRQLHLDHAAAALPAWLERAAHEDAAYHDFLAGLLEEEVAARASKAITRRLRRAAFPFAATIEQFDFTLSIRTEAPGDLALP